MNPSLAITPLRAATALLALSLAGCSSVDSLVSGDKLDYRSQVVKAQPLDVPPDLTQLARDSRYQPQTGVVSAAAMRQGSPAAAAAPAAPVAPLALGDLRIERQGNARWLVTPLPPETLFPLLRSFWQERGFTLALDSAEIGVMETEWTENRAKLPNDVIRRTLGRVLDAFYSTSERDRFRTRLERTANGSTEVYISHRGMVEVYPSDAKDRTIWQPRPTDPELEAEFLSRLMVKLGAKEDTARATVAAAPAGTARARSLAMADSAALELDEGFDRAWRQVGLALDRSGFTVEDRDRSAGLYFVRYVDPKSAGKDEPGFFSKLFGAENDTTKPQRWRVLVQAKGAKTQVSVQNSQGGAEAGEIARNIVGKLVEELK